MNTKHTDSVEAIMKEFERRMPLITSHGLLLEARLTPTNYQKMKDWLREELTTLQATQSQQVEEAVRDIIKMADALELECGKDGDKGTNQWMAFKGFRNTIRDKYLTPNHQD